MCITLIMIACIFWAILRLDKMKKETAAARFTYLMLGAVILTAIIYFGEMGSASRHAVLFHFIYFCCTLFVFVLTFNTYVKGIEKVRSERNRLRDARGMYYGAADWKDDSFWKVFFGKL